MKYYVLPHPFKEKENVIFGDLKIDRRLWDDFKNPNINIPIKERKVIISDNAHFNFKGEDNLEELVKTYETNFNKNNLTAISKAKFNLYSNLGVALSSSYLLFYYLPAGLMTSLDSSLEAIGTSSIGLLAKASLCAIPAVFGVVRNVGIPLVGDMLGVGYKTSRLYKLNELEKPLKEKKRLVNLFGSDIKENLVNDMKELNKQFENTETYKELETAYKSVSEHPFISTTEYTLNNVISTAEKENLPYGKIQQLKDMKKDILAHRKNNYIFAPIKVVNSGKQADNLKDFLNESKELRGRIITEYNENSLNPLSNDLEKLFGLVSRYDFGDTNNINDKGFLKDFYHGLYSIVGKENEKIRKSLK